MEPTHSSPTTERQSVFHRPFHCNEFMFNDRSHRSPIKRFIWNGWMRTETKHSTLVIRKLKILIFSQGNSPHVYSSKQFVYVHGRRENFNFLVTRFAWASSAEASQWACNQQKNLNFPKHICGIFVFVTDQHYCAISCVHSVHCRLPLLSIRLSYLAEINTNSLAWNCNRNIWINVCNI